MPVVERRQRTEREQCDEVLCRRAGLGVHVQRECHERVQLAVFKKREGVWHSSHLSDRNTEPLRGPDFVLRKASTAAAASPGPTTTPPTSISPTGTRTVSTALVTTRAGSTPSFPDSSGQLQSFVDLGFLLGTFFGDAETALVDCLRRKGMHTCIRSEE